MQPSSLVLQMFHRGADGLQVHRGPQRGVLQVVPGVGAVHPHLLHPVTWSGPLEGRALPDTVQRRLHCSTIIPQIPTTLIYVFILSHSCDIPASFLSSRISISHSVTPSSLRACRTSSTGHVADPLLRGGGGRRGWGASQCFWALKGCPYGQSGCPCNYRTTVPYPHPPIETSNGPTMAGTVRRFYSNDMSTKGHVNGWSRDEINLWCACR